MEILTDAQGTPAWFESRIGLPTASEFSKFVTPARGNISSQADTYIAELLVEQVEGMEEKVHSYYMERGRLLEGEARNWYEFEFDVDVEQVGLIKNKGAGWSPDGLVGDDGGIEIKCPKATTHVKWLLAGEFPPEHKPQVHGALIVGEREWTDFVSYCPGYKPLLIRVTPDDYTVKVEKALEEFNARYEKARAQFLEG